MKLLSFGEIIWDVYPDKATLGGAPLNFSAHSALLGADVSLISSVGNDELGISALKQIKEYGIDVSAISLNNEFQSGKCLVTLNENGVPKYEIATHSAYDSIEYRDFSENAPDVIAFGTLALRYENNRKVLSKILSDCPHAEIFVDVNIRPPFYSRDSIEFCFERATIVKVSDEDAKYVSSLLFDKDYDEEDFHLSLCERYGQIKLIVITKGEQGACCYDTATKTLFECPAQKTKVVSTVGAGDSFGAAFLARFMQTGNIQGSMLFASRLSAFVVSRKGAIPEDTVNYIKNDLSI